MTFRSWRSHMTRQPYPAGLPYLSKRPFPTRSGTQCPPKESGWNIDSMGFPWSPRTPESEFGRRSYDLPKFEVTHDSAALPGQPTLLARTPLSSQIPNPLPSKGIQMEIRLNGLSIESKNTRIRIRTKKL